MPVARGVPFPSKTSAVARFSDSKRVFIEISNAIRGSNIRWRGRSFAASVPSDSSKPRRGRKRISKDERQAMVESFVDKYRASNAGKFPNPSVAHRQLGGSYYVIRQILQEIEYKSKESPISKRDETLLEKEEVSKRECQPSPEVEEVSSSETTLKLTSDELRLGVEEDSHTKSSNNMEMEEPASKHFEAKQGPQVSTWVQKPVFEEAVNSTKTGDHSNSIGTHSHQIKLQNKEVLHPRPEKPEDCEKEMATSEGSVDFNGPKGEVLQEAGQEVPASDKFEKNISRKKNEEDQLPKSSTVWGNLRSFADGIINLWRKM